MMHIIKFLNIAEIKQSEPMLKDLKLKTLQDLYCECVNMKKTFPLAYSRLSNELNRRKDEQIHKVDSEHCAALERNVAEQEVLECNSKQ